MLLCLPIINQEFVGEFLVVDHVCLYNERAHGVGLYPELAVTGQLSIQSLGHAVHTEFARTEIHTHTHTNLLMGVVMTSGEGCSRLNLTNLYRSLINNFRYRGFQGVKLSISEGREAQLS